MDAIFPLILITVTIVGFIYIAKMLKRPEMPAQDPELMKLAAGVEATNKIWETQFKNLREEIKKEISESGKEDRSTRDASSKDLRAQIENFTGKFGEMKAELEKITSEVKEVSSFQNIFKSPKLTGEWGELSLDYVLAQYFPQKGAYESQHQFASGEKVDFALTLPNGRILPMDSKYPQEIFSQYIKATNDQEKESIRKNLVARVKKDIDDIATKYILPNEGTVDLAIMYVPAESLYYEIVSKEDLNTYAWKKKVAVASPNNFILTIAIILDWFKKADISKKTDIISKKLQRVAIDGEKLADTFRKLGDHLSNARGSYDESEKRLTFLVDRVRDATSIIGDPETPAIEKPGEATGSELL